MTYYKNLRTRCRNPKLGHKWPQNNTLEYVYKNIDKINNRAKKGYLLWVILSVLATLAKYFPKCFYTLIPLARTHCAEKSYDHDLRDTSFRKKLGPSSLEDLHPVRMVMICNVKSGSSLVLSVSCSSSELVAIDTFQINTVQSDTSSPTLTNARILPQVIKLLFPDFWLSNNKFVSESFLKHITPYLKSIPNFLSLIL